MGSFRITGKARYPKNVRDVFPSSYAKGSKRYPKLNGRHPVVSDAEPNAIFCKQCGYPLSDHTTVVLCPSCGSDNFLGKRF